MNAKPGLNEVPIRFIRNKIAFNYNNDAMFSIH